MSVASTLMNSLLLENTADKVFRPAELLDHATFLMCHKTVKGFNEGGKAGGRYKLYAISTAPGGNGGTTLAQAQTTARANQFGTPNVFQIPPVSYYEYLSMPGLTWAQAESDEWAFTTGARKMLLDGYNGMVNAIAPQIFLAGNLGLTQVKTIQTTTVANDTIVLNSVADANKFYEGSYIDAAASPNSTTNGPSTFSTAGTSFRARGSGITTTGMKIIRVDRNNGYLVFNQAVTDATNGLVGLTASSATNPGDTIFVATGDASVNIGGMIGLEAICPAGGVTTSTDSFYNVNRYTAGQLSYGTSYSALNSTDFVQAINNARTLSRTSVQGRQDTFIMHPATMNVLKEQLRTQNRYVEPATNEIPVVGFGDQGTDMYVAGVKLGNGCIGVEDTDCPINRIWGVKKADLEYIMLNDGLKMADPDGRGEFFWAGVTGNDYMESAMIAYHNFFVKDARNLINIQINSQL